MALWASVIDNSAKVNLLMVCVENGQSGLRTAQDFGKRFQLPPSLINGYVEQKREGPSFGQLGCQGFVVLGPHGEFAMQRTIPCYLEKGEMAFSAVEKLLSSLWSISLTSTAAEQTIVVPSKTLVLASVGVVEMDMEHQEIEKAMDELRENPNLESMGQLLALWITHSAHEEQLFAKFDFGRHRTAEDGNAATKPHCEHHRLIACMMEEYIREGAPSASNINQLVAEIQRHMEIYDAAYAGKLGEDANSIEAFLRE